MIQQGEWTAPDVDAAENEVAKFICGLVNLVKPEIVVETGCYLGHTSNAIRIGLAANHKGALWTCDTNKQHAEKTCRELYTRLPDEDGIAINVLNNSGEEMIHLLPDCSVDIAFLDSGGDLARFREAQALIPKLAPIAYVLLHDSLNSSDKCHANISAVCNWPSVVLPYGRGLTMFCIGQEIAQARIPR